MVCKARLQLGCQTVRVSMDGIRLQRTLWQGNLHGRVNGKGASWTSFTPRILQDVLGCDQSTQRGTGV